MAARWSLLLLLPLGLRDSMAVSLPRTPARASTSRLELRSSGGFKEFAPSSSMLSLDDSWPEAAMAKDEVKMGHLKGGTQPVKVRIGSSVFVRKKSLAGEPEAIMMEALTNKLYQAAGVKSEHCRYYPAASKIAAKAMMLCRWIDGLKPVMDFTDNVKKVASEHFVLDAVLANYDVGGMSGDSRHTYPRGNVGWNSDNQLVRVDNGGALAADGLGQWKPTEYPCKDRLHYRITTWTAEPFQLWDFWNYSEIYSNLSQKAILAQLQTLMLRKKDILAAVDNFGNEVATQKVRATLQARLECLERISKDRPDLFDIKHAQAPNFNHELPEAVCAGVRSVCADLIAKHSAP